MEKKKSGNGYLFVYFSGEGPEGEQVYFAVSEDGLHWMDLNDGKPVLISHIGDKGVRDPFILRAKESGKFFIIGTDLRMENGYTWEEVQINGSRSIVVWESEDLIHWSKERLEEVGIPEAGCVWAPEAIYDEKQGSYLVFWASSVKEEKDPAPKHRIYASYTKDFKVFTPPVKYIERKNHIIDTTIIKDKEWYYRFSKDETTKNIRIDRGENLLNGPFESVTYPELEKIYGVEGPEAFPLDKNGKWCLIIDQFASDGGYLPLICEDLKKDEFHVLPPEVYDMGKNKKRHGSVLVITADEMRILKEYYGN